MTLDSMHGLMKDIETMHCDLFGCGRWAVALTFAYTQLSLSVQGSHSSHMGHMMVVFASQISLLRIQQCTGQNYIE